MTKVMLTGFNEKQRDLYELKKLVGLKGRALARARIEAKISGTAEDVWFILRNGKRWMSPLRGMSDLRGVKIVG